MAIVLKVTVKKSMQAKNHENSFKGGEQNNNNFSANDLYIILILYVYV